jgi:uncharacterized protein (DUF305 family)
VKTDMFKIFMAACLLAIPASAQSRNAPMAGMRMNGSPAATPPAPGSSPSSAAYRAAMETMMKSMETPYTGNADHDFVTGMLPHHQGAVDMAKIELQYGRDPALKALARDVIASQSKEQVFMRSWLARHPMAAPKP